MLAIVVEKRVGDYAAHVSGNTGVWGAGKSASEAIGECIRTALSMDIGNRDIRIIDYNTPALVKTEE